MSRLVSDEAWAVMTLWQEARGEPREGQVAVAEVIRNRMQRKYQSDGTVVGTVLRPYQFSGWNTGDANRRISAVLEEDDPIVVQLLGCWREAIGGASNYAKGAVLYLNPTILGSEPPWLVESHRVAIIGRHHFYDTGKG